MRGDTNDHHLLFTRESWNSNGACRQLRNNHYLKVALDVQVHRELHSQITTVPLLDHRTSMRVANSFVPDRNSPFKTIDNLQFAIEEALKNPQTDLIQRQLGDLAILALSMQKEFIWEGYHGRL